MLVATTARTPSSRAAGLPVPGASPRIEGVAHALRFLGADRFETNLAVTLALRGKGGFPYTTSDRTSGGASSLGAASGWWGARSCPKSVIVVAGDNFADALAATSLSDPTDKGAGPLLERVAAADPLFDPIGGFARVAMGPRADHRHDIRTPRRDHAVDQLTDRSTGHGARRMHDARGARSSSAAREQCHGRSSQTC